MLNQSLAQLDPEGLEAYFTDVEYLREIFKTLVAASVLSKRLLVIHGVGGVGKSSLLRMFRLHCKRTSVQVGLASGDEIKSAVDVLTVWTNDLKVDKLKLSSFGKTIEDYRVIQAKVEEQVHKAKEIRDNAAGALGKAAAKTVVETAVSAIPVVGPLISGLSGMGAEALVDWLGSFLKKPDIDLLLDPVKALTDDFLADITAIAPKHRLVLMLDTFEQMTTLEEWARDLAQRLHPNVLLVVAGRAMPNWSRQWPGWLAQAEVQELKPMTDTIMRELVSRYYATMRGGEPDPAQVEAILTFARGLPIVVTSAVRLWVQYGVEDFQAVKPQVVADLVDRLLEGVPPELVSMLEAAAAVRWFNKDILRAVTGQTDVNAVYDELRRFPFTRPRAEGMSLHDTIREIIDESLRVHDPVRHRELHQQAVTYFEARLVQASGQEAERLELERLYHSICANEEIGIQSFQEMAEKLLRYRLVNRLRGLLNDVNTQLLQKENSLLWRQYYNLQLAYLEGAVTDIAQAYQTLSESRQIEPRLRAYALSQWGMALRRTRIIKQPGGLQKLVQVIEQSNNLLPESDPKRIVNLVTLGGAYHRAGETDKAGDYLEKAITLHKEKGDLYGVAEVFSTLIKIYAMQGDWRRMFDAQLRGLEQLPRSATDSSIYSDLISSWTVAWSWAGRYQEAEQNARTGLSILRNLGVVYLSPLRDLIFALGMQARYAEAVQCFAEAVENYHNFFLEEDGAALCFWAAILSKQGEWEQAEEYLKRSWVVKTEVRSAPRTVVETVFQLGKLYELREDWQQADDHYRQCLDHRWANRRYFECGALTGLVRVKHAQADYTAIPPFLSEAEQLAQQYEYNDHLASLRLTQAHIAWDDHLPEWGSGFEEALRYYQHALIHALRYNRFLLDEVLWGGGVCTPLRPLIPHCQERGEEGRQMLAALCDWWQTGVNDIGVARPDTISPIPEGIPLLEAERLARQREPGDSSPQPAVLKQIESVLN